jgi:hypothetical protein
MTSLASNLGGKVEALVDWQTDPKKLAENQEKAWKLIRQAIDEGKPCYAFGFGVSEFYVIYGYDDTGYYCSGTFSDGGAGPVSWQLLGKTAVGLIDVHCVSAIPVADDKKIVKDALEFALELAQNPNKSIFPGYTAGLAGYDKWIKGVADGKANPLGMSFNSVVWHECRELGAQFLREAVKRLNGKSAKPLEEAAEHYEAVARQLQTLSHLFPHPGMTPIEDKQLIKKAVSLLQNARDAEAYGLKAIEKVVAALR